LFGTVGAGKIMRTIKVFLASPSDVPRERDYVQDVVDDFNDKVSDNFGLQLRVIDWEKLSPDLGDPQDLVNKEANNADLVVVIFGARFGSPTRSHPSGTAEEFSIAYERWLEKPGRPRVWVYFRAIEESKRADPGPELSRLLAFKDWFKAKRIGLASNFDDAKDFRYRFAVDLYRLVAETVLPSDKDANDTFGILGTVSDVARRGIGDLSGFRSYLNANEISETEVVINPRRAPLSIYSDGLSTVKRRFWTTAFLDSAYWDGTDPALFEENRRMLDRIKANGGTARRLLIGTMDPKKEAQWLSTQWATMEDFGLARQVDEKRGNFQFLRDSMLKLSAAGFATRVGYDRHADAAHMRLPIAVDGQQFDPTKFGLTLYDDMRMDIFQEGRIGVLGSVSCFTPAGPTFTGHQTLAVQYFEHLWDSAMEFSDFLKAFDEHAKFLEEERAKLPKKGEEHAGV
jgi:hypothetical protein